MIVAKRVEAGHSKAAVAARYKKFAQAYIANGRNATQAAITAGYSPNGADVTGCQLLRNTRIAALIDEIVAKAEPISGLTAERTLRELARLAYSDTRKLYRPDGALKSPDEWDDDTAAAVSGLEVTEEFEGAGSQRVATGYNKKLKMWDKGAALNMAIRHLGLFERDNSQRAESLQLQVVLVGKDG